MYDYLVVFTLGIVSTIYLPSKIGGTVKKTYSELREKYPQAYAVTLCWRTSEIMLEKAIQELKKRQGCQHISLLPGKEFRLSGIRHDGTGENIPFANGTVPLKEYRSLQIEFIEE